MGEQVLGADVGGTYTDFLVVDRENTGIRIAKVLTTPGNQSYRPLRLPLPLAQ